MTWLLLLLVTVGGQTFSTFAILTESATLVAERTRSSYGGGAVLAVP